ncbi:pectinesterase [Podospora conica]|nr:pectinesterase [Schizothecium conicum]
MKPPTLLLLLLPPGTLAASRTTPPSPSCLIVTKSPTSSTHHRTLTAALTALAKDTTTTPKCVFLHPGVYAEQVSIPSSLRTSLLSIYGSTTDTTTYKSNTVTLTSSLAQAHGLSNDQTGTLRVPGKIGGVRVYNVDVVNGYGKGSQAVAVSAQGDLGMYGCRLEGWQDTVLANEGRQVFVGGAVVGVTDFVFGRRGRAWFERCDIGVLESSVGYITASGRESASTSNFFVINNSNVSAAPGQRVAKGSYYLGRPWGEYAQVVFQRTYLSDVINGAGWRIWNTGDERTKNVLFGEYGNTGPGASGTRASFSKKLSAPVTMEAVLGSGFASAAFYDAEYF